MCKISLTLKLSIAALLLILLVLRCSNGQVPEADPASGYISYTLRWDSVAPGHPAPQQIRCLIYPSNNGPMIQTDSDATGIKLRLPPDKYKIVIFNNETNSVNAEIDTTRITPLYTVVIESLIITPGMDSTQVVTPHPTNNPLLLAGKQY